MPRYGGDIVLDGHQSKILVTDFSVGSKKLLYSTIEVLTYAVIDSVENLVLWVPAGETGEFSIKDATSASMLSGTADIVFHKGNGELTASFTHLDGMNALMFSNGLRVMLVDRNTAYRFWAPTLTADPFAPVNETVLVHGPYLVRGVMLSQDGKTIELTGDVDASTTITVWGSKEASGLSWNGVNLATVQTTSGSLTSTISAPDTSKLTMPPLIKWKARDSLPERFPTYNDSGVAWVGK